MDGPGGSGGGSQSLLLVPLGSPGLVSGGGSPSDLLGACEAFGTYMSGAMARFFAFCWHPPIEGRAQAWGVIGG